MHANSAEKLTAIVLSVFRANGRLLEWGTHFSQPHGLTSARWQVLGAIALAPHPLNIPQIADAMGVTRQGALKQVKLLVDDALVQPLANPAQKRSPLYVLTDQGQETYQALQARWQTHAEQTAAAFTDAELDAAIRVLSVMSQGRVKAPSA